MAQNGNLTGKCESSLTLNAFTEDRLKHSNTVLSLCHVHQETVKTNTAWWQGHGRARVPTRDVAWQDGTGQQADEVGGTL